MKLASFYITLSLFFVSLVSAGQSAKFIGIWEGKLNVGVELRIVFIISDDGKGNLVTTAKSPDQSDVSIKCDTTFLSGDDITIEMTNLKASFVGHLSGKTLKGEFTQGQSFPLELIKVEKVAERNRPQHPHPPFPYTSEDVTYTNADQSLTYGATITMPPGVGPFPAAVLITGSGAQNRDEEILGHKFFAVLADHLSRQGYVILRVDDRGVGKSTGVFSEATTADFAKDVHASVDYLLTRKETDKSKVGLIGHSEGGMIAPIVATQRKDISFVVLMAGPGVKITDLMAEQASAIMGTYGASEKAVDMYRQFYKEIAISLTGITDTTIALATAKSIATSWANKTNKSILREVGMKDEESRDAIATNMARSISGKWFQYFIGFDPQPYLEKLQGKVLAINGDKDIQVVAKQNLPAIEAALKKSGVRSYEIKELPGLNHLFQTCKKCNAAEYGDLEETTAPIALNAISDWLNKNIK